MIPGNIDPVTGLQDYQLEDGSVTQRPPGFFGSGPAGPQSGSLPQIPQPAAPTPAQPEPVAQPAQAAPLGAEPAAPAQPALPEVGPEPSYVPLDKIGTTRNPIAVAGKNLQTASTAGQAEAEQGAAKAAEAEIRANELSRQTAIKRQAEEDRIQAQREQMAKEHAQARADAEKTVAEKYAQASAGAQWANRSTGQQIAGYVAAIAGGFLSPYNDGRNRPLEMIMQAIDRDIAAAQVQAQAEEKKLGRLGETQKMDRNDLEIARAAALDKVANGMEQELSGIKSDITRGNYLKQVGEYRQAAAKKRADATTSLTTMRLGELENARNRALQREQMEMQKRAAKEKQDAEIAKASREALLSPELGITNKKGEPIRALSTSVAEKTNAAMAEYKSAYQMLKAYKNLAPGYLSSLGDVERKKYAQGLLTVAANLANAQHARSDKDFEVKLIGIAGTKDPDELAKVLSSEETQALITNQLANLKLAAGNTVEGAAPGSNAVVNFPDPDPEYLNTILGVTTPKEIPPKQRIDNIGAMLKAGGGSGSAELASDIGSEAKALLQEIDANKFSPKELLQLRDTLAKAPPKARFAQIEDAETGPVDLLGVVTAKMTEMAKKERESRFIENEKKARREKVESVPNTINIGGKL